MATEVKADIEKGFGTWKVKLKVNMLFFCVPPRENEKRSGSTQSARIRENKVNRDRRKGRRGWGRVRYRKRSLESKRSHSRFPFANIGPPAL